MTSNVFHHIDIYPNIEAEQRLSTIENLVQEGVPEHQMTSLIISGQRVRYCGPFPNPKGVIEHKFLNRGGRWRCYFKLNPLAKQKPKTGKAIGIDFGLRDWIITSDNERVPPHQEVVDLTELILAQMNERDSKHVSPSTYAYLSRCITRNAQRLLDAQQDHANKIAADLVERYDMIAVEAINVNDRGIQNDRDFKEKSELANWEMLRDTLELRCKEAGRTFVLVNQFWSSQECSNCTYLNKISKNTRWYTCSVCGHEEDRDLNAAKTILKRGYEILDGTSERVKSGLWFPKGHADCVLT